MLETIHSMSEPEFSDNESNGLLDDISCDDYCGDSDASRDAVSSTIEIDMDSSPINTSTSTSAIKITKPIEPQKQIITKKPIIKKEPIETKPKPLAKSKVSSTTKELKTENATESATDHKFQFNEETIEYFSKDILGDVKKICVVNSRFNNDTALLCLLIKLQIIKEYKCVEKKCKTGKTWLGQPIQLLIHRKNEKQHDLSINNLELICANCYIAKYGLDLFIKVIAKTIYTCTYCGYPLSNFKNSKKKERICMACESKIMSSGYFEQRSKFIDQLSDTIDEASSLKKDEFKSSNYFSQVSQYKSFDSDEGGDFKSARKIISEASKKTFNDKPIITLNLTVPNIDDLISEE